MSQFRYRNSRVMEPKTGVKYSTTYYRFDQEELDRLRQLVYDTLVDLIENNTDEVLREPLPGFPRTGRQPNYSVWDIISDLHDQIAYHMKDLPSGMLGRWNRLADQLGCDWSIDPVPEVKTQVRARPQFASGIVEFQ